MYITSTKPVERSHWLKLLVFTLIFMPASYSLAQDAPVVQMIKRNASGFAIDGNNGGSDGQDVYLYNADERNSNQQWIEISRSSGYYSYQKVNTDFCLDGNRGGENGQNVYLWNCDAANQNQHWRKVEVGNFVRLEKRNAPDFSLDGNRGGQNGQSIFLQESDNGNQNQQWQFNYIDGPVQIPGTNPTPIPGTDDLSVDSLAELRNAIRGSNQTIVLRPGTYNISELPNNQRYFEVTGNNNTIDLTGVRIEFPVNLTSLSHFSIQGSGNTFIGGTLENTYPNGAETITDYVSYNLDRDGLANGADMHFQIAGDNTTITGTKMLVRGSFPFGYGSIFGIGGLNSFGLSKRGGMQIIASNTVIDGIEMTVEAFGHGIFIQDDSDNTLIRNSLVQGLVRETNDMLAEGRGSLVERANGRTVDGDPIPRNEVNSLAEDGIRSYGGIGSVRVENSTVRRMRGGIRLWLAASATVVNSTAVDNGDTNYNLPRNAVVDRSVGNFSNGPLHDFAGSRSGQDLDITILASPNAIGSHDITNILGDDHDIVFRRANGPEDSDEQRVIRVSGNNSTIRNETEYAVVLESGTRGNTVVSAGDVRDNGSNDVRRIDLDL